MPSELINTLRQVLPEALYPVLGVSVTYTPASGSPVTVSGIWDESEEARDQGGQGIAGRFWTLAADLPAGYAKNDVVTIEGTDYFVRNNPDDNRDGVGVTLFLRLK